MNIKKNSRTFSLQPSIYCWGAIWGLNQTKAQVYVLFKEQSVFANMRSFKFINVKANLFVTPNQLGWNNNCYDGVCRNSCYEEAGRNGCNDEAGLSSCYNKGGRNSCYDKAGCIGILLRILPTARPKVRKTIFEGNITQVSFVIQCIVANEVQFNKVQFWKCLSKRNISNCAVI